MCDDITEIENQGLYEKQLTRRKFNLLAGGAGVSLAFAGCAPGEQMEGLTAGVTESDILIDMPDGTADAYFVHPGKGKHPGVLVWPDITGLRPAQKMMAKRLAGDGYAVLVINPYYRHTKAPVVEVGETFRTEGVRERIFPFYRGLNETDNRSDAVAYVDWLDNQSSVDSSKKIGTTGYCMGGWMVMHAAAERSDRIGAAASFHGGPLVTEEPDSPHLLIPEMKADFLFAIAENDDERAPEHKNILRKSVDDAGLEAEIEVYKGAQHGWCPPDSAVYNEEAANKAWERKLALFERALG